MCILCCFCCSNNKTGVYISTGSSVRNSDVFKVLQDAFLESQSSTLGLAILQSLDSIYRLDPANYFIVQEHHTLSLFLERLVERNRDVQVRILPGIGIGSTELS